MIYGCWLAGLSEPCQLSTVVQRRAHQTPSPQGRPKFAGRGGGIDLTPPDPRLSLRFPVMISRRAERPRSSMMRATASVQRHSLSQPSDTKALTHGRQSQGSALSGPPHMVSWKKFRFFPRIPATARHLCDHKKSWGLTGGRKVLRRISCAFVRRTD